MASADAAWARTTAPSMGAAIAVSTSCQPGRCAITTSAPLEETVWTALPEVLLDPDRVFAEAEALADAATVQARQLANEVAALEAKRASLIAQQEKLLDRYLQDDAADPALYKKKAAALAA